MAPFGDLAACVDGMARSQPERIFLSSATRQLSYGDLRRDSGRFVAALQARGVVPGDRVAVQVEKSVDAVVLYVACLRLGAVFVPINVANKPNEVEYFLRDSQPRLMICRPPDRQLLEAAAQLAAVEHLDTLGTEGEGSFGELTQQVAEAAEPEAGAADAVAAIVYTSGTTGRSKGAMLTRGNLASNAAALVQAWRFVSDDILLHSLPLFHVHGLFAAINTVIASGASLWLMPKFDAATALALLPGATVYMGVPTHYTRLLQEPGLNRESTARMRLFVSGSAPLLAETHREFLARTGHMLLERYGMTETLMNTSNPYDGPRRPGSVGPALPGVGVRVALSGDAGQVVGALEVRGPNVFAGYWRDAEKTRGEFTADGWFKTGDLGSIDADGYVTIVGRAKDLVISGGYNVYPKEVEMELDGVTGVLESAVFGVPHPDFGEGVTAAIVARAEFSPSEAAILGAVKSRLAAYKVPKRIVFVTELPRNTMGKVQKNILRAAYADLYST
jgi:malonyl-CoA/methylmalonyl-CoA synthetase